jgi:hypothetical protein
MKLFVQVAFKKQITENQQPTITQAIFFQFSS